MSTVLETHSGLWLDYDDPRPEAISLKDIAVALARMPRFAGYTEWPFSVAEHALHVYQIARDLGGTYQQCEAALHHDDHEAYLCDLPTPLKRLMGEVH